MSKRASETQGGEDRYGNYGSEQQGGMAEKPQHATAAQMARRKLAQPRKPTSSSRSSRAGTPNANPFGGPQQSMPSFNPPADQSGAGFGGNFNFTSSATGNPFAQPQPNGTPPPSSFQFGASATNQTPAQQNGGSNMFGNSSASFGSTFGATPAQPQQNGFKPSTTSLFSNQNNAKPAPAVNFGQNNETQSQLNGASQSTTSSFPGFGKQNGGNLFQGFGQSQPQTQSTPSTSFGGLGQSSQPQNGEKSATTPSFGGFGQSNSQAQPNGNADSSKTNQSSIFSSFGQPQNGINAPLASSSQAQETPKASTSSLFSGLPQNGATKSLFGASAPPTQAPKTGDSVLSGLDPARASTIKSGMFTQNNSTTSETPKPNSSSLFNFGPQSSDQAKEQETPKASAAFTGFGQQPNGVKANIFSGDGSTASEQQTPKPNSLFNFGESAKQPLQQSSTATPFKFGQSQQQEDTSMTTPGNTPQKSNLFQAASQPAPASTPSATPAGEGRSMFDRITRDEPPSTAQKPSFTPSTSLFFQPANSGSTTNKENETPAASKDLFSRITRDEPPTTAPKQPPSFTPSSNFFSKSTPADTSSMVAPPSAAPWLSHAPAAPMTTVTPPTPQPPTTARKAMLTTTMSETIPEAERSTFKVLNEGLRRHLSTQDPNADWTTIMQYYLREAAKVRKKPEPKFDAPVHAPTAPSAPASGSGPGRSNLFASKPSFSNSTAPASTSAPSNLFSSSATPKTPTASTSNMFASVNSLQQTPKPSSSLFQPPATAPVSKKRPAPFLEEEDEEAPATEKRVKPNEPLQYPSLPENASATSKLFQAALNKSSGVETGKEKEKEASISSGFKPAGEVSGGFMPSTSGLKAQASSAAGFTPSTSGSKAAAPSGMPSFSAPVGGFLASFGKAAAAEDEKDRKKRRDNDYDSDEETEEQWEKRDKEEQEAKRRKIAEAAKAASGFVLPGTSTTTEKAKEKSPEKQAETPMGASKGLFDRVSKEPPATAPSKPSFSFAPQTSGAEKSTSSLFASKTPGAEKPTNSLFASKAPGPASTTNIFGHLAKPSESEKDNEAGDNTWKPSTPIKFGGSSTTGTESTTPAAPPPVFGNLFGAHTQKPSSDTVSRLNVPGAKPTIGFNFGAQPSSLAGSRATTPGVTTDGEGASTAGEADDEEQQTSNEAQVEDQTGLRPEEKEHEELLFSVPMAKTMKQGEKKDPESGEITTGWVEKGKGPLYILKHKETGVVRALLKIPPFGKAAMNFSPLHGVEYRVLGAAGKMVQGPFVDHIAASNAKKPSSWMLQVREKKDAEEIARVLMEHRAAQ